MTTRTNGWLRASRSFFVSLGLSLVLSSCAGSLVLPSASKMSDAEAAIFTIDRSEKTNLFPELNFLYNAAGRPIIESKAFQDFRTIKLPPGEYLVGLKVYSVNYSPSFPTVRVQAKAGHTYLFSSVAALNDRAVLARFKEVPTASLTNNRQ